MLISYTLNFARIFSDNNSNDWSNNKEIDFLKLTDEETPLNLRINFLCFSKSFKGFWKSWTFLQLSKGYTILVVSNNRIFFFFLKYSLHIRKWYAVSYKSISKVKGQFSNCRNRGARWRANILKTLNAFFSKLRFQSQWAL